MAMPIITRNETIKAKPTFYSSLLQTSAGHVIVP
jgi:hypothetical protein